MHRNKGINIMCYYYRVVKGNTSEGAVISTSQVTEGNMLVDGCFAHVRAHSVMSYNVIIYRSLRMVKAPSVN